MKRKIFSFFIIMLLINSIILVSSQKIEKGLKIFSNPFSLWPHQWMLTVPLRIQVGLNDNFPYPVSSRKPLPVCSKDGDHNQYRPPSRRVVAGRCDTWVTKNPDSLS